MFRKRSAAGKRPKAVRKRSIEDDEEDEVQQGNPTGTGTAEGAGATTTTTTTLTTQQQIQYTKKKRKLLTSLQYKRGLDTNQLLSIQQNNHNHSDNAETDSAGADAAEPDPLSTPASSSQAEQGSQEGVLESKHKQAMESYIQQKMKIGAAKLNEAATNTNNNNNDDTDHETTEQEIRQHAVTLTREQLYRELAVAAAKLAGKTDNTDNGGNNNNNNANTTDATKDGDIGAGGAMLVAGTGIAEVILPVDERLKTHKDTNESVQARNQSKNKNSNAAAAAKFRNTSSTATSYNGRHQPTAVPNRFFVPNTMASFPQSREATAAAAATSTLQQQSATNTNTGTVPNAVDDERLGFDAVKRQREGSGASFTQQQGQRPNQQGQPSSGSTSQQRNRSSDDRVFRKFVSRQKDARK
jgi:hypothetical protein